MINANTDVDLAAACRNSGGTPAARASAVENHATGISTATDNTSMAAHPVLSSLLAVLKSPLPVASATYFWKADLIPTLPKRMYAAVVMMMAQMPYPPSPRWAMTIGMVISRGDTCANLATIPHRVFRPTVTATS